METATAPMELRPLTLGEILDRTAQLYRSNFLLFVGITIFPTAVLFVMGLAQIGFMHMLNGANGQPSAAALVTTGIATVGGIIVGGLVYAVLLGLSLAATNRAVSDLYLGQPASIGRAYKEVKPHWFRYIWVMFVAALYAWAPAVLLFIAVAGGAGVIEALHIGSSALWLFPLIVIAAALLIVPFGIWMTMRYSLSVPASIFEDLRVHAALKRSVFLTKNSRGRIFVLLLLVVAIAIVLSLAIQMPLLLLGFLVGKSHAPFPVLALVGNQVGSFIVNALLGPVYGITITLFYYDLRIRKEGFDIQWMMDRAKLGSDLPVPGHAAAIVPQPEAPQL
ncbi:MAG TPA: glycerophosphoryl diester phosphodiesterase membrane domain-containing protein [Acidisarcina sp.]